MGRRQVIDTLVRPEGLEPSTPCLEGRCSIHLSYGRVRSYTELPFRSLTDTAGQPSELGRFVGGFRIVMIREMA